MSDWTEVTAGEVMHTPVKAVVSGSSLADAMELLADERISGLVVTTAGGRPVGVISHTDVVSYLAGIERDGRGRGIESAPWSEPSEADSTPVEAVMTPELVTVDASARMPEVCRVLVDRGVHRVLVEDEGAVVGIVSTMDVMRALHGQSRARAKRPARPRREATSSRAASKAQPAPKKKTTRA